MLRKTGYKSGFLGALVAALTVFAAPAHAAWALNMTRGATTLYSNRGNGLPCSYFD